MNLDIPRQHPMFVEVAEDVKRELDQQHEENGDGGGIEGAGDDGAHHQRKSHRHGSRDRFANLGVRFDVLELASADEVFESPPFGYACPHQETGEDSRDRARSFAKTMACGNRQARSAISESWHAVCKGTYR